MSRSAIHWRRLAVSMLLAALSFGLSPDSSVHQFEFGQSLLHAGQSSSPDLVVSSISNPPASAIAGTSFSVTDTTGNSGTATADASTTRYRLSVDTAITGSDSLLTGSRSVPTLKKGASSSGSVSVTIPSGQTPGTYYLGACADDLAVIGESNENNNCLASTTTIVVSAPASISNLSPPSGPRGSPVTINGANFGATQGTSTVTFNGSAATPTNWSATAITVPVPPSATTGPVIVTVGGVASNGVTFTITYAPRINTGGSAYTDGSGNSWAADQSYSVSNLWGHTGGSTFSTTNQIANTDDDVLYQSERFGNFGYKFDLPNGRYNLTLHFAEIYSGTSGPNQRIFNVSIEGVQVLTYYDIAAQAGFETATTKTFPGILVQDGQLNIDLVTVVGNAKLSAIQVLPDQPAKLGINSINNGTPPPAPNPFPIIVQSQDSFGVRTT